MIDPAHLRIYVIEPTLRDFGYYSRAATQLLLGTIAVESAGGRYLQQKGDGPAIGIYQMEPATHDDIWQNYVAYRPAIRERLDPKDPAVMRWDLRYATIMARLHYLRVPEPLPDAADVWALGAYWKEHYNTRLGAGTVEKFVRAYRKHVLT